jgi:hypothetical protein
MKFNALLFSFFVLFIGIASASNSNEQLLKQLISVNAQWEKQPEHLKIISTEKIENVTSYNEWIATHLMLVEKTLRVRDVSNLSAQQKTERILESRNFSG